MTAGALHSTTIGQEEHAPLAVQKKRSIGETSYPATCTCVPQFAGEITGVMLEVDNAEDGDKGS